MSWEEFTGYIIKAGIHAADDGDNYLKKVNTVLCVVVNLLQYIPCEVSNEIKLNNLEKIKYFPKIDKLGTFTLIINIQLVIVVCDHSKIVKLYKPIVSNLLLCLRLRKSSKDTGVWETRLLSRKRT
jgi:hypothetical protein